MAFGGTFVYKNSPSKLSKFSIKILILDLLDKTLQDKYFCLNRFALKYYVQYWTYCNYIQMYWYLILKMSPQLFVINVIQST